MKESGPVSSLSFIEPHEEAEAKRLINDQFVALTGKPYDMRVAGYLVAVKLYIRPEELKVETKDGNLKTLYMPQSVLTEDKYQSVSGVVVGIGPQAYKGVLADGSPKYPEGPWCKIGDIVLLPRFESMSISFRGVAMALLPDDRVAAVISDPTDVQPINTADKF
jgi:hypothetical protein